MPPHKHTRVLIIGSGPAGYTAAIYAARAALAPVLIHGLQPGGQLTITTDVENWPGETAIMGPDLMAKMEAQARHLGVELVQDIVTDVRLDGPPFLAECDSGAAYAGDSLIIATGAQARWLGLPSETRLRGGGVSACATCDGFFYRGRTVAVVGGGNTAVEEALFLTNFAAKVYLIHRRDSLRADKVNQARLFANPKVEPVWDATVAEVLGHGSPETVSGVRVDLLLGGTRTLDIDGLFIAIGTHARDGAVRRPARDGRGRLSADRARFDGDQRPRRVRRGRRQGQAVPPGGDRGGHGVHGRARSRTLACAPQRARDRGLGLCPSIGPS